mgnify:CR=1 FL=1
MQALNTYLMISILSFKMYLFIMQSAVITLAKLIRHFLKKDNR